MKEMDNLQLIAEEWIKIYIPWASSLYISLDDVLHYRLCISLLERASSAHFSFYKDINGCLRNGGARE